MKTVTTLAAAALLAMGSAAFAAPCTTGTTVGNEKNTNTSSSVDPGSTSKVSPGAKGESPGTVGAMNNAGSAAATSPSDVQKQDKGEKTASQQAKGDGC